ncbi:TPA: hypothetical protein N0F65_010597 [Lagenidium giganteum]|uniref:Uncharacterized protein n=1 Tax=Lagenidium giganteum TaxID=4803 RepID=A0AAV2ZFN6_9STRA|nr:TPA: hypothetical protein N0F65_010597 [Lagenidium giganteum]
MSEWARLHARNGSSPMRVNLIVLQCVFRTTRRSARCSTWTKCARSMTAINRWKSHCSRLSLSVSMAHPISRLLST